MVPKSLPKAVNPEASEWCSTLDLMEPMLPATTTCCCLLFTITDVTAAATPERVVSVSNWAAQDLYICLPNPATYYPAIHKMRKPRETKEVVEGHTAGI